MKEMRGSQLERRELAEPNRKAGLELWTSTDHRRLDPFLGFLPNHRFEARLGYQFLCLHRRLHGRSHGHTGLILLQYRPAVEAHADTRAPV